MSGPKKTSGVLIGVAALLLLVAVVVGALGKAVDLATPALQTVAREIVRVDGEPMLRTCYESSSHTTCELR